MAVLDFSPALEAPTHPHAVFSPEAVQLPKPRFTTMIAAGPVDVTVAPSESDTETEGGAASSSSASPATDSKTVLQLEERLHQLKLQQQESMAQYLHYARALQALQISFPVSTCSDAKALLSTQPLSPGMRASVTSASRWGGRRAGLGSAEEVVVTLKVKELPTDYTQEMLAARMVERGFKGWFDLLYVPHSPLGFNMGFAIVNFTQPEYAAHFRASFQGECLDDQMRQRGQSLVVEPAPTQGYEANYCQFALKWSGSPPLNRSQLCGQMEDLYHGHDEFAVQYQ
eukprot:s1713_g5.t1